MASESEWKVMPIETLCEGIYDGPHATPKKTSEGPIFLGISSLSNGRLDLSQTEHLSEQDFGKWTRRVTPREDDLVFSYETRLGEAALVPAGLRCCLGRRMGLLRVNREMADPSFLLYAYLAPEFQGTLKSRTVHGSTVPRIPLIQFGSFPIRVPALQTQRAIAEILRTLDRRLDLLNEVNETLEAMARAIFKSWFVDFDPVRAKAERRAPEGMDAATAALFPSEFQNSALGSIPSGWNLSSLSQHSSLNPESWSKSTRPSKIRYVDLANTKWGRIESVTEYDREYAPSRAQRVLRNSDSIIGTVRPGNGSYAFINEDGLTGSTGFAVLRPKEPYLASFVYLAATERGNIDRLSNLADGGAYPAVRPETVLATPVVSSASDILEAFATIAGPLLSRIAASEKQMRTLAELRDTLLPRLISGKLRVPEAEVALAEAI